MKKSYFIDHDRNEIVFDLNFFNSLVFNNKKVDFDFSLLTLKLAFLLMEYLDEYNFKKLPSRKMLAETLNVSRTSITNSLHQLELSGFLNRQPETFWCFFDDESEQEKADKAVLKELEEKKMSKKFNDKFRINVNYNNYRHSNNNNLLIEQTILTKNNISEYNINELIQRINVIEKILNIK